MNADAWIIRPFNAVFCGVLAAFLLILAVASALLRRKDERVRQGVIVAASLLTLIGFFIYKAYLAADQEYDAITQATGGFNW